MAENPATTIRLGAVNGAGYESGNADAVVGRTIPLLQDPDDGSWISWAVTYRDVVILDTQRRKVGVFNLTEHDLQVPEEYAALKALLLSLAGE